MFKSACFAGLIALSSLASGQDAASSPPAQGDADGLTDATAGAGAASGRNYFSWKEGAFRDNQFQYGSVSHDQNDGRMREMEFSWGKKAAVRLTGGGLRLDGSNKVTNCAQGLAFKDGDEFVGREFRIKDRLMVSGDPSFGPTSYVLADNVDASAREVSHIRLLGDDVHLRTIQATDPGLHR
jgi:hypothetical protein